MSGIQIPEHVESIFPRIKGTIETFKDHEIKLIEPYTSTSTRGECRWGRPGSRMYETFIIFRPSTIILYGDLGSWIFRQDGIDLAWLRGAIKDPNYLLSKTTNERRKAYDSDKTKKYAEECIAEMRETRLLKNEKPLLDSLQSEFESVDWTTEQDAYNFFSDVLEDSNPEGSLRYTWDAAGGRGPWAALFTFLNALNNRVKLEKITQWQLNPDKHPLTCGNDSSHILHGKVDPETNTVILVCPECDYVQETIPDVVLE